MDDTRTDWGHVASWYDSLIGEKGGYFHTHVIFPKTLELLALKPGMKVLDVACGQGAFSRVLAAKGCEVVGVDQGEELIAKARQYDTTNVTYLVDDARTLANVPFQRFDRIVCILAMQNIDPLEQLFRRAHELLVDGGRFIVVLMHPVFREPRITGWEIDEDRKLMYRRVDRYMAPLSVPITMHPGKQSSEVTWAFHRPISEYARLARQSHLYIDTLDEWCSDKQSVGKAATMENHAREEIPMFMAIRMKRIDHA